MQFTHASRKGSTELLKQERESRRGVKEEGRERGKGRNRGCTEIGKRLKGG